MTGLVWFGKTLTEIPDIAAQFKENVVSGIGLFILCYDFAVVAEMHNHNLTFFGSIKGTGSKIKKRFEGLRA